MEEYITYAVYVHALLGGIGLLTGMVSIVAAKGKRVHTQSGKIFSIAMISSALISLVVARLPGHQNLFLFLVGVFTIYMVLSGNRALTLKPSVKQQATVTDKTVSGTMLAISVAMILIGIYSLVEELPNGVLFLFFGGVGLFLSTSDLRNFTRFQKEKHLGLKSHIGRMVGALIASVTAFIVAGLDFTTVLAWLGPTILGVPYIIYWTRRVQSKTVISAEKG